MQKLELHPLDPLYVNVLVLTDLPLDQHIFDYYYNKHKIYARTYYEKLHAIIDYYHSQGYDYVSHIEKPNGVRIIMKYFPCRIDKEYKPSGKYSEKQTTIMPIRFDLKYENYDSINAVIRIQQDI